MNISYIDFERQRDSQLKTMIVEYESVIIKSRPEFRREIHHQYYRQTNEKYQRLCSIIAPHYSFFTELKDEYKRDSSKEIPEIFEQMIESLGNETAIRILPGLITLDAMNMLFDFLREPKGFEENKLDIVERKPNYSTKINTKSISLREIALLHVYNGDRITRGEIANRIALRYNHKSGDKLYQHFTFYLDRRHRINMIEGSRQETTIAEKIKLFERVIELLEPNSVFQNMAIDDLTSLKTKYPF